MNGFLSHKPLLQAIETIHAYMRGHDAEHAILGLERFRVEQRRDDSYEAKAGEKLSSGELGRPLTKSKTIVWHMQVARLL